MRSQSLSVFLLWASLGLAQQVNTSPYRGGLVTPPLPKPRFVLNDTSGAAFDFRQRTEGHVTLLFFGYTYCPDQCPMHMANLGAALNKLPVGVADRVKLVFVTTDPARDTPAVLRRWLAARGSSLSFSGNETRVRHLNCAEREWRVGVV
jgi:protein SCO1/2